MSIAFVKEPVHIALRMVTERLTVLVRQQFSGRLDIAGDGSGPETPPWRLHFCFGRLLFAEGGVHPHRRLARLIRYSAPQLDWPSLAMRLAQLGDADAAQYLLVGELVRQRKLAGVQAAALVRRIVSEVLFEVVQHPLLRFEVVFQKPPEAQLVLLSVEQALADTRQLLSEWRIPGLRQGILPEQGLALRQPEQLREQVSQVAFTRLEALLDGRHSLLDVAARLKRDPATVARTLLPFIEDGSIGLLPLGDLPLPAQPQAKGPLIACLDDSPLTCQTVEQIVVPAGYRFLGLSEPIRAMSELLRARPDLLLLDLVMPELNGYELCQRLRRSTAFQNLPIVILTGNDGLIDRVRAKMSGATDFISKPIRSDQELLGFIEKHLACQATA